MAGAFHDSRSIVDLLKLAGELDAGDALRFHRIYSVIEAEGRMRVPDSMAPWVERTFGAVSSVEKQRVVRVTNLATGEAAIFNDLRARRPVRAELHADDDFSSELANDPWAQPLESTPEDLFGRLEGDAALTAANVAKYDALHSLLVFKEPDPLRFDRDSVRSCVEIANRWFAAAHEADEASVYPFFLWNCLWRSGGSIVHGHAQVQLARGRHYAKIEELRSAAQSYREAYGCDYFEDLAAVHTSLGLCASSGEVHVMASLTPVKEKEVVILSSSLDGGPRFDEGLADALFETLAAFRDRLGVRSFNVGAQLPPLVPTSEDWDGFPAFVHVVDRGSLGTRTSDIGSMELFAEPVVASDPFAIARALTDRS